MNVLAIDPGNITGWALYGKDKLISADIIDFSSKKAWHTAIPPNSDTSWAEFTYSMCNSYISTMVIEFPRIYDRKNWKGDPNDLLFVACIAGKFAQLADDWRLSHKFISPQQWKGQRPKSADHLYTKRLLSMNELKIVLGLEKKYSKSKVHNVLDAIGIGLYAVGRR